MKHTAAAVIIDRHPFSDTLTAVSHGRVAMACCGLRILLALLFSLRATVSTLALIGVVCAVAAVQLYALLTYLPYYHETMNKYEVSFATVFAWAAMCTLVAYVRNSPAEQVRVAIRVGVKPTSRL